MKFRNSITGVIRKSIPRWRAVVTAASIALLGFGTLAVGTTTVVGGLDTTFDGKSRLLTDSGYINDTFAVAFTAPLLQSGGLQPGEIVVADAGAGTDGRGAIFAVNPTNGQRRLFSDFGDQSYGPLGSDPNGIAVTQSGDILVADGSAGTNAYGALFNLNPSTGVRTIISDFGDGTGGNPLAQRPQGVSIDAAGNVFVAVGWDGVSGGAIVSVAPNGFRAFVSSFPNNFPWIGRPGPTGELLVPVCSGPSYLLEVNRATGQQTVVSNFSDPADGPAGPTSCPISVVSNSTEILVTDIGPGTTNNLYPGMLFSIDPATGFRTVISDFSDLSKGPMSINLWDVLHSPNPGEILALDFDAGTGGNGAIFRINRANGTRTYLSDFGNAAQGPLGMEPMGMAFFTGSAQQPPVLSNVAVTTPLEEGGTATLSGNIADANAGDTFTLTVNWGDGSPAQVFNYPTGTTVFNENHQYLDDDPSGTDSDNYTINLTLADNNGGSDTDSAIVAVNNSQPTLSGITANPSTIAAGDSTTLSGTVNDAGTLDPHTIEINWGDSTPNTILNLAAGVTTFDASHQYNSGGGFNIAVTATDDDSGSASGSAIVNVALQQSPVLSNVTVTTPINENDAATLSGNISDSNAGDTFALTVNWGDGSPAQTFNYPAGTTLFSETHQYPDDNPTATTSDNHTINLSLSDNGGGSDTASTSITVNNAHPALSGLAANPSTISVGSSTTLNGTVNDAGTLDTHQVVINWGDGSPTATLNLAAGVTAFSASHQYNSSGTFNIGVTTTDDDTGSADGSASVTVDPLPQQPPVLSNVAVTSPVTESGIATLTGNISDPNAGDTFNLIVNWGDGSPSQFFSYPAGTTSFSAGHQYRDDNPTGTPSDNYTISLALNDNGGGSDTDSVVVTVNNIPPTLSGITVNPATITVGGSTTLSGSLNDVSTFDSHSVTINWGDGSPNTILNLAVGSTAFNATHQYNASGTFDLGVTATDDDMGSASAAVSLTVNPLPPAVQEKIVFTSYRDGNPEIYVMNSDGTNQIRLTNNTATDALASFSPDGSRIVFDSNRDGNREIYVMNADGTNQTRLTTNLADDAHPAFSVDGSRITFTSNRDNNPEIYVMNVDGSSQTQLTNHKAADFGASFSPDGSEIVFTSRRAGNDDIYVMNADGTNQTRLTSNTADDMAPSFSPDGSRIVFNSSRNRGGIFVMNADGTNQTPLTNPPVSWDSDPSFSPDGSKIVFNSNRGGGFQIYVMDANGSNQTLLTNTPAANTHPSFRLPEQRKIVFASFRHGAPEIYVMNADGGNQTRLTTNGADDYAPSLSPDGSRIAFVSLRDANYEIYVMNADGSNQTRLTKNGVGDFSPRFSHDGSRIAFASYRDGNQELYLMNADGTGQTRLTYNLTDDSLPSFSPDGSRITFVSNRDGNSEIYVMNSNGTSPIRLTNDAGIDTEPCFSPDGGRIAFTHDFDIYMMNSDGSGRSPLITGPTFEGSPSFDADGSRIAFTAGRNGNYEIYVMDSSGANQMNLTNNAAGDITPSFRPAFRPSSQKKIVFVSERDFNREIYAMNADGTSQINLTNSPGEDSEPSVSADGSRIAFASERAGGSLEIYVMNADGSNVKRLTDNSAYDSSPTFSPDGSRIAFVSYRDGNSEIYVMNADGSNQINVSNNPADDIEPTFSPDGGRIAFNSTRGGNTDIYVMNANGSNQTRLTYHPAADISPSYSPDGSRIAYASVRGNNYEIYVMTAVGGDPVRLTLNAADDFGPSFSPDGNRIAFASRRDNNYEIYVVNVNSSSLIRLTNTPLGDFSPSWDR